MNQKKRYAMFFCVFLVSIMFAANIYSRFNDNPLVASGASIKASNLNIGLYSNSACTVPVSSISWGSLKQGSTASYSIWVKNTGGSKLTLSMTTSNWSPTGASQFISLSWNQNNKVLNPNQVVQSTLNLAVSSKMSPAAFKVNIVITATG